MLTLSKSQHAIYDMDRYGGGAIGTIAGEIFFADSPTVEESKNAVQQFVSQCEILRTRIVSDSKEPRQTIVGEAPELAERTFASQEEYVAWAETQAKIPLDLYGSLCRITVVSVGDSVGVFMVLHHIIADAWTMGLMADRLTAILRGETPGNIEPYSRHLEAQEAYEAGKRYQKDKEYWLSIYERNKEITYFNEKPAKTNAASRKRFTLTRELSEGVKRYCANNGVSEYVVFVSALAAYVYRVTGREQFYLGTPMLNRSTIEERNTAGVFVNTVALSVETEEKTSFTGLCAQISETVSGAFRHQKYPYTELLRTVRAQGGQTEVLFDVMLSYQNIRSASGTRVSWYHSGAQTESLQIHIDDRNDDGLYHIDYDYQTEKFTAHDIERMHEHIMNLLVDGMENGDKTLLNLEIMSAEECKKVVFEFNDTASDYPKDKCVHELFEMQVERTPDKVAVVACDKTLTYRELNEQANTIAHGLIEKGVKPGDIVAFKLPRRSYLISVMFGILKAGAAYLPIDPEYPKDRVEYMLSDSGAKDCVTEETVEELLRRENTTNPRVSVSSENLCYCIYTSGSTGMPKGVLITHANVCNYCHKNEKNAVVDSIIKPAYESIVCTTTVGFDIFVTESLLPVLNGYRIVLADEEQSRVQKSLNGLIKTKGADVLQTTPSKMKLLVADTRHREYLKALKAIVLGGEVFDAGLYTRLRTLTQAEIFNIYGPTEATVWVTNSRVSDTDITIGKPIANTQIYILDKHGNPVPIGVTGELCIAGDCVGAGYLNRPELTAEKFVANPFGEGRMYKTGDLAKWREDGNIEYIGRNDFQVKIRGLRIEPGEIEAAIAGVEGVRQVAVVVRKDSGGRQLICAFYTGEEVDAREIRAEITKMLPRYMVPHVFTHMETMPMTSSGKINRNALPEIALENIESRTVYEAPVTDTEKRLCEIMEETLNAENVGLNDDFFELGGDSLKAIELVSKAHQDGIYFNLQNVFDYPTINLLCKLLIEGEKPSYSYKVTDFDRIHSLISGNVSRGFVPQKVGTGDLLLTGATGFLGIHILAEYLKMETGTVYCLVRGNDERDIVLRLKKLLQFYFKGEYTEEIGRRIIPIRGDVAEDDLISWGIPKVDTVIHSAASVKHYGSYKYFYDINVKGTVNAIAYAKQNSAKLIHISTLSVSGDSLFDQYGFRPADEDKDFYETSLFIGQPLDNVYIRSKFEAEKAVLEAIAEGVDANIVRVGNLTNRYTDAMFQPNYDENAFVKRFKAVAKLGILPDYLKNITVDMLPVDCCANAILIIAKHYNKEYNIFHVHHKTKLDQLVEKINKNGIRLRFATEKAFVDKMKSIAMDSQNGQVFEALMNDMDENLRLSYVVNIFVCSDFTQNYLCSLGYEPPNIDNEYIRKYIRYFRKIGYLEEK